MGNCGASNVTSIIAIHLLAQAYHNWKSVDHSYKFPKGNTVDYMALGIKKGRAFLSLWYNSSGICDVV